MTTKQLQARVQALEAARVARWWQLYGQLHGELLATLTDAQLLELAGAADSGDVPDWWAAAVQDVVGNDPRWLEARNLEQSLVAAGYTLVEDQRGVVVWPGLERRR